MKHCQALSEARRPRCFVAKLRCSGNPGGVTSDASRVVNLLAGEHGRGGRHGRDRRSCITRIERSVVLACDRDFRYRGDAFRDQSPVLQAVCDLFGTSAARRVIGKKKDTGGQACENADSPHEPIKERTIVGCAHRRNAAKRVKKV
jgi:hypothetical protein